MNLQRVAAASCMLAVFASTPSPAAVDNAEGADTAWPAYGLTADEQRFSPLKKIDLSNVRDLGLAWSLDLPAEARSLEATPLEIDGVLYFTASLTVVHAVDAISGKELWQYDPKVWTHNARALRTIQGVSRGLAYDDGALFVGAADGRLISLDAKTGKPNWIVDTFQENDSRKQITGVPRVFAGKVIIGHAGADFGTRGYVTAYDTKTGKQVWRFYTVPGEPAKGFEDDTQAMAAKTWGGEWWRWGGGGTVWNAITYDSDLHRIYLGTGNSANYNADQRSPGGGDNLFLSSIVAVDAETGKYLWHYQTNPRESWDYKATADIVLANLTIDGKPRKVLMQAPTNGFFYVLDRETGKLISAEKLGKVTWAERVDLETGRPIEAPNIRYEKGPVTFWPSPWGVHNWQAMSFSPQTGLVYIPTMKLAGTYTSTKQDQDDALSMVIGTRHYWFPIGASFGTSVQDPDDGTGALVAWDPVTQKPRWTVKYETIWNGGTLTTGSNLVFQGTGDGWFHAYDASDGRELWKYDAKNGIIAPPITYAVKGTQYISLLVGYGGATAPGGRIFDPGWRYGKQPPRVLTFVLGGTGKLPVTPGPSYDVTAIDDPSWSIDATAAARGEHVWNHTCLLCHGVAGASAGSDAPDLRASQAAHDLDALRSIVKDGTLSFGGMPQFDEFTEDDVRDLLMYIREVSRHVVKSPGGHSS